MQQSFYRNLKQMDIFISKQPMSVKKLKNQQILTFFWAKKGIGRISVILTKINIPQESEKPSC
jgi:hypothetical protein